MSQGERAQGAPVAVVEAVAVFRDSPARSGLQASLFNQWPIELALSTRA